MLQRHFLCPRSLHHADLQVTLLLEESSAESVQEGLVPGSRRLLGAEQVEELLGHLVEHRDGLCPLGLVSTQLLQGALKVMSVLQAGERGDSPHLSQEHGGPPVTEAVGLRQITAQRAEGLGAEHQQGQQRREGQGHGGSCRCCWPG